MMMKKRYCITAEVTLQIMADSEDQAKEIILTELNENPPTFNHDNISDIIEFNPDPTIPSKAKYGTLQNEYITPIILYHTCPNCDSNDIIKSGSASFSTSDNTIMIPFECNTCATVFYDIYQKTRIEYYPTGSKYPYRYPY
ncbi:hypothetical protein [Bacteroides sp.]|uniref:hypothetical protein n=1 Tax=Bacteroides sp. TaxID=29523 RepID=UPI002622F792|nr:hypothetical protein [Bacteroides sp.]MDD3039077.1 hypothetical protein [Bacteroides sp.]